MRYVRHSSRGFTLLEVLIAMVLSAVLLGTLTAGMSLVVDEWQDSNTPLERILDHELLFLQLESALLGVTPHSYIDVDTLENNVFFVGTEESLTWVSTVSPQANQQLTAWQLLADERDGVILKVTPAYADNPEERFEELAGVPLFPDFDLEASYLTIDDQGRPEWLDEWLAADYQQLPMAVRLRLYEAEVGGDELFVTVPVLTRQHETIEPVDIE